MLCLSCQLWGGWGGEAGKEKGGEGEGNNDDDDDDERGRNVQCYAFWIWFPSNAMAYSRGIQLQNLHNLYTYFKIRITETINNVPSQLLKFLPLNKYRMKERQAEE